jgi:hypothetical protein
MKQEYIEQMEKITETLKSVSDTMKMLTQILLDNQKIQQEMISDVKKLNVRVGLLEAKIGD